MYGTHHPRAGFSMIIAIFTEAHNILPFAGFNQDNMVFDRNPCIDSRGGETQRRGVDRRIGGAGEGGLRLRQDSWRTYAEKNYEPGQITCPQLNHGWFPRVSGLDMDLGALWIHSAGYRSVE